MYCVGVEYLSAALAGVHLAGDVACDTVSDGLALNGGDFCNNLLVVIEVSVEGVSVLF